MHRVGVMGHQSSGDYFVACATFDTIRYPPQEMEEIKMQIRDEDGKKENNVCVRSWKMEQDIFSVE